MENSKNKCEYYKDRNNHTRKRKTMNVHQKHRSYIGNTRKKGNNTNEATTIKMIENNKSK